MFIFRRSIASDQFDSFRRFEWTTWLERYAHDGTFIAPYRPLRLCLKVFLVRKVTKAYQVVMVVLACQVKKVNVASMECQVGILSCRTNNRLHGGTFLGLPGQKGASGFPGN